MVGWIRKSSFVPFRCWARLLSSKSSEWVSSWNSSTDLLSWCWSRNHFSHYVPDKDHWWPEACHGGSTVDELNVPRRAASEACLIWTILKGTHTESRNNLSAFFYGLIGSPEVTPFKARLLVIVKSFGLRVQVGIPNGRTDESWINIGWPFVLISKTWSN